VRVLFDMDIDCGHIGPGRLQVQVLPHPTGGKAGQGAGNTSSKIASEARQATNTKPTGIDPFKRSDQ
jgi:hypothetical protein